MYPILHNIFKDKTDGNVIKAFGFWHIFYLMLAIAIISLSIYFFKNKSQESKDKLLRILVAIPFALYIADFFLMPFAYGEISVDKLPFHSCTLMSIMCFLSNHHKVLRKYRMHFGALAFFCNLMYISFPSGVIGEGPLTYRAVQTLLFHTVLTCYGLLSVYFDKERPEFKHWYRDLIILGSLTVWALLGNAFYSGTVENLYTGDFNWFFIKADPFGIFPESIAPYILPAVNIFVFFALEMILYAIIRAVKKEKANSEKGIA